CRDKGLRREGSSKIKTAATFHFAAQPNGSAMSRLHADRHCLRKTKTMTDTSASAVAVPAAESKLKQKRGPLNQGHLRKLRKVESVLVAAQDGDHASALDAREITARTVSGLAVDVEAARTKASEALQHTTAAHNATADEEKTARNLIGGLQEAQK